MAALVAVDLTLLLPGISLSAPFHSSSSLFVQLGILICFGKVHYLSQNTTVIGSILFLLNKS